MVDIILTIIQMLWGINTGITNMVPQFRNLLHTVTRICILLQNNFLFIYNSFESNSEWVSLGYQQTQIKHLTFAANKIYTYNILLDIEEGSNKYIHRLVNPIKRQNQTCNFLHININLDINGIDLYVYTKQRKFYLYKDEMYNKWKCKATKIIDPFPI